MTISKNIQQVERNLAAIFSGSDDRLIVLLKVSLESLHRLVAIRWIEHLRDTYDCNLEILLLLAACNSDEDSEVRLHCEQLRALAACSEVVPPLVVEVDPVIFPGCTLHRFGLSSWVLWNGCELSSDSFSQNPRDYGVAPLPPANLGWLVSFRDEASLISLSAELALAPTDLRRVILELSMPPVAGATQVRLAHLAAQRLITSAFPLGGLAVNLFSSAQACEAADAQALANALQIDATEAMLDEFSNAVHARRMTVATRSPRSLSTRF